MPTWMRCSARWSRAKWTDPRTGTAAPVLCSRGGGEYIGDEYIGGACTVARPARPAGTAAQACSTTRFRIAPRRRAPPHCAPALASASTPLRDARQRRGRERVRSRSPRSVPARWDVPGGTATYRCPVWSRPRRACRPAAPGATGPARMSPLAAHHEHGVARCGACAGPRAPSPIEGHSHASPADDGRLYWDTADPSV